MELESNAAGLTGALTARHLSNNLAGFMQSDHVLPRDAVSPNGGARRPWRALNFAIEKPAGTAGSTLVN
jgi:hypothetical protein